MSNPPHWICPEWLIVAFGFATICVVLGFCLWRIMAMDDVMRNRETMVNRVLENQATIIAQQKQILYMMQKAR
jgi:hypothetical protein